MIILKKSRDISFKKLQCMYVPRSFPKQGIGRRKPHQPSFSVVTVKTCAGVWTFMAAALAEIICRDSACFLLWVLTRRDFKGENRETKCLTSTAPLPACKLKTQRFLCSFLFVLASVHGIKQFGFKPCGQR